MEYLIVTLSILLFTLWPNSIKLSKASRAEYFFWDFILASFFVSLAFGVIHSFSSDYNFFSFDQDVALQFRYFLRAFIAGLVISVGYFLYINSCFLSGITYGIIHTYSVAMCTECIFYILQNPHKFPPSIIGAFASFFLAAYVLNKANLKNTEKAYRSKKARTFSTIAGIMMGFFFPLLAVSLDTSEQARLNPHIALMLYILGFIISYSIFSFLFRKTPLTPPPATIKGFFDVSFKNHVYGLIGGTFWSIAVTCRLLANIDEVYYFAFFLYHLAPLAIGFFGIFLWKEFAKNPKLHKYLIVTYGFFLFGVAFLSVNKWSIF